MNYKIKTPFYKTKWRFFNIQYMTDKTQRTSILQFLPAQLVELTHDKKTVYKGVNLKNAYIIDYMHNLLLKVYYNKSMEFNLLATIVRNRYGQNSTRYTEYLVEMGYIRQVANYKTGSHAKKFRMSKEITDQKIDRYHNDDKVLVRKHNEFHEHLVSTKVGYILPEVKQKMIHDANLVSIDANGAMTLLNGIVGEINIYNLNKYSIEVISSNNIYCHFDDYGRVHTNFTVLKSNIRKNFLSINNDPLMELDIDNSQPLFMMKIIQDSLRLGVDEDEFKLYRLLTTTGKFYQHLINKSTIKDKKKIKKMVYTVFFGKNHNNKANKLFSSIFPTIFEFIKEYKETCIEKGYTTETKYKYLAHQLQRSESNLIYNVIIKEIMDKYPEIPIITIHDSIMFPQKYREVVTEIFTRNINETFNIG